MIDDGSGNLMGMLLQLVEGNKRRETEGAARLAGTAKPGETAGQAGLTPKAFAALFGRGVAYNPNRILVPQTGATQLDQMMQAAIDRMTPTQQADLSAMRVMQNLGVAGATTAAGAEAARQTGGRQAGVADTISKATAGKQIETGIKTADTALTTANTQNITAQDVAQRIQAGITSMQQAPADVQKALAEKLAYGTTATDIQTGEYKNQLGLATLREALRAQNDPKHPLHRFLAANGLDIHTVMAGGAMGLANMFDDYSRMVNQSKVLSKQAVVDSLKAKYDFAEKFSLQLGGKVTPQQIVTYMDARESGKPVPKGLEQVGQIIDAATTVFFRSNVMQAAQKGDPTLIGIQTAISGLEKLGTKGDEHVLETMGNLARTGAAYSTALVTVGPRTPQNAEAFDAVMAQAKKQQSGFTVNKPWLWFNSVGPTNTDDVNGLVQRLPAGVRDALPKGVAPRQPGVSAPMSAGPGSPALPFTGAQAGGGAPAAGGLSPEDMKTIQDFLTANGLTQPPAQAPTP